MWKNVGGVLVNLERLCYVNFTDVEEASLATLYFTDRNEPVMLAWPGTADDLRAMFEDILGVQDEQERNDEEGGASGSTAEG